MTQSGISDEVRELIAQHIDSVGQLELLIQLSQEPGRWWTPADAAKALRVDAAWVAGCMEELHLRGLLGRGLAPDAAYQFAPRSPELAAAVDGLVRSYAERRVTIISLIYSKPVDQIQTFADAFKFRKD